MPNPILSLVLGGMLAVAQENARKHCAAKGHDFRPHAFSESGEATIGRTCAVCGIRECVDSEYPSKEPR
jgi:hypothetical protein